MGQLNLHKFQLVNSGSVSLEVVQATLAQGVREVASGTTRGPEAPRLLKSLWVFGLF